MEWLLRQLKALEVPGIFNIMHKTKESNMTKIVNISAQNCMLCRSEWQPVMVLSVDFALQELSCLCILCSEIILSLKWRTLRLIFRYEIIFLTVAIEVILMFS